MKKLLAILMSLLIVSTMVCGMVAYADEPTVTQESTEGEVSDLEQELPQPTEEDWASAKQITIIDFSGDAIKQSIYILGTDGLLEYYKTMYAIYQQTALEEVEYEGSKALLVNESEISEASLNGHGMGLIKKEGFFADVTKFFSVDVSVSGNFEEGTEVVTYKIVMPSRLIGADNAEVVKNTVIKTVVAGQNNNFMFTCTKINWINCLIGFMVLAVLVLVVLIIIFSKKKKNALPEEKADKEEIAETVEEKVEAVQEAVEEKTEEVKEEVKEEVAEVVEEVVEEIAEATEEKTEE